VPAGLIPAALLDSHLPACPACLLVGLQATRTASFHAAARWSPSAATLRFLCAGMAAVVVAMAATEEAPQATVAAASESQPCQPCGPWHGRVLLLDRAAVVYASIVLLLGSAQQLCLLHACLPAAAVVAAATVAVAMAVAAVAAAPPGQ